MKLFASIIISMLALTACNTAAPMDDSTDHNSDTMMSEDTSENMTSDIPDEPMLLKDTETTSESEDESVVSVESTVVYTDFSQEMYEAKLGKEAMAIYFHADWCPTCKALEKRVTENLSDFPNGTQIMVADFDTETELKEQYGVISQTTIVVLDKEGNIVDTLSNPSNKKLSATIELSL